MRQSSDDNLLSNADLNTRLLTTREAAAYLGVSESYLNKLCVFGGSPAFVKLSRAVRYRRADLDYWVATRLRESTSATPRVPEAEPQDPEPETC